MPATIPSPAPTQTSALPSLVTQFAQPSDCRELFRLVTTRTDLVTFQSSPPRNYTTSIFTSDQADSRFSSCQPSGWDRSHFTFSPGLCPSGWVYNSLTTSTAGTATVSQAYCCAPEYFLIRDGDRRQCKMYKSLDGIQEQTRLHDAWYVEWQPSDKLPVSLPDLPSDSTVDVWTPGTTASYRPTDGYTRDSAFSGTNIIIVSTVLPIVFVAVIIAGCVFCVRANRKLKRQEAEQQKQDQLEHLDPKRTIEQAARKETDDK